MDYFYTLILETYKILFLLLPLLTAVAMIVWLDRRVWAFVQKRKGPNVVGPFGLFQTLADALKYIFKEIIIPASANKSIFILAPVVTLTLALIARTVKMLYRSRETLVFRVRKQSCDRIMHSPLTLLAHHGSNWF